jgi:hypothetical protein
VSVISGLQNLSSFISIRRQPDAFQASRPAVQPAQGETDLLRSRRQLLRIYRALEAVADSLNVTTRFRLDLPDARSSSPLGLDLTTTAAFLASAEEINASPTSFSPFGPDWDGGSTAPLTISREYDGSNGSGDLTFEVRRAGVKGEDDLRFRIYDPSGARIRTINVRASHDPDRQYDIRNGLYLQLGAGALINRDTATIQINQNIGSVFDPNRPLGGVRNDNPNFQYYGNPNTLPAIVDGSFQVNGQSIAVATTDTLNTIVDRINQSAASVSAQFNPGTERIEFTQATPGSANDITISGDTSNFVQSTKLDTATQVDGIDPDTIKTLDNVAAFSAVQAGSLVINGRTIAIDPGNDNLTDILGRINASDADVRARFDESTQRVTIEANNQNSTLTIDGNGTGLFSALNIQEGRVDPVARGRGISRQRSYDVANAVEDLAKSLNLLFDNKTFIEGGTYAGAARAALSAALGSSFAANPDVGPTYGLRIDASADNAIRGRIASVGRNTLTQSLQLRGQDVKEAFVGASGSDGLIGRLLGATREALTQVNGSLGRAGSVIDTYV